MAPEAAHGLDAARWALAWALGLLGSFAAEAGLEPRPPAPWRRPAPALLAHAASWTAAHAVLTAILSRPGFAAAVALAAWLVLVLVGRAKFDALREPFVFQDFEYFTDALRHPRLYLPFLGWGRLAAGVAGLAAAGVGGWRLEPALAGSAAVPAWQWRLGWLAAAGAALVLARAAQGRLGPASWSAARDLQAWGLAACLWRYGLAERRLPRVQGPFAACVLRAPRGEPALPHLVSLQSESFFDARESYPQLRPELLASYDALRARALAHGRLIVPAWGANTLRTEFAFLTGLSPRDIGVHRYQPYRRLAGSGIPTIATALRRLGYRTVCVHPYHGSFYRRDALMPRLGFDDFVDVSAFAGVQKTGPYVGDLAVADHVSRLLGRAGGRPLYVHVITMENHGPLHWETVDESDRRRLLRAGLPPGCDELAVYARHLGNADAMLASLAATLASLSRPGGLCLFGDHVPIMPRVYERLGEPAGHSHYLLWSTREVAAAPPPRETRAESLAADFLRAMDLL